MRRLLLATASALGLGSPAFAVSIDWVTVPGTATPNACDTQTQGCFGSVADTYRIGRYEVTNAQYAEFLNAVADTDAYALYSTSMGSGKGGITRTGSSGGYSYSAIAGREDMPVNYVSFYDALRFANWLHNGQPTGAQDAMTTEDGAYTMIAENYFSGPVIARNGGATIFLPSEDEWYKAAYFDGTGYFDYPAGSNTRTLCSTPTATANRANCERHVDDVTDVGSYTGSPSPNDTFDQGGNVWELNEAIIGSNRGARGGGFDIASGVLAASYRHYSSPGDEDHNVGFRVAMIPEPGVGLLVMAGLLGLAAWGKRSG